MKDLPTFGQKSGSTMSGVMAGGAKEKGVLMSGSAAKKTSLLDNKPLGGSTTDMFHQDPNNKQIL